jgi:predicted RNA-binding Zn ribbon-like protein
MPKPGHRDPAPPALRIVQSFVNTNDVEAGRERLNSPASLHDWLVEHDLLAGDAELSAADLSRATEMREAVRALVTAHNDLPADVQAGTTLLNAEAERAELVPRLDPSGASRLEPRGTGLDGALGQILSAIHAAIADGTWRWMKACERDSCRWAFYDHSKNHSGRWCHPAVCGTRERSRRAYQRRRAKTS